MTEKRQIKHTAPFLDVIPYIYTVYIYIWYIIYNIHGILLHNHHIINPMANIFLYHWWQISSMIVVPVSRIRCCRWHGVSLPWTWRDLGVWNPFRWQFQWGKLSAHCGDFDGFWGFNFCFPFFSRRCSFLVPRIAGFYGDFLVFHIRHPQHLGTPSNWPLGLRHGAAGQLIQTCHCWLVVWNMAFMTSPIVGTMIQSDELHHFSGGLKPPTTLHFWAQGKSWNLVKISSRLTFLMVRITALSGELVLELEDVYTRMVDGQNVRDLKKFLAVLTGHPRFKQRLLVDAGPLRDDIPLPALANMQLVILNFADPDETSAERLCQECAKIHVDQVEMLLQKPQDPNVRGPMRRAPIADRSQGWYEPSSWDDSFRYCRPKKGFFAVTRCRSGTGWEERWPFSWGRTRAKERRCSDNICSPRFFRWLWANVMSLRWHLDLVFSIRWTITCYLCYTLLTALHLAAGSGCLEMVQLLVENGANIDVATTGGQAQTPWHFMPPGSEWLTCCASGKGPRSWAESGRNAGTFGRN